MNTIPLDRVESPKLPYFSTLKPSPSDTPDTLSTQLDFHKRINTGKPIEYHTTLPRPPTNTTAHHTLGLTYHSGHSSDLTRPGSLLGTSPSTTPIPTATIHGSLLSQPSTDNNNNTSSSSTLNYALSISGDKFQRIEGEGYHDFSNSLGIDYLIIAATPECRLSGDASLSATFLNNNNNNNNILVRPITWKHKIEMVPDHHHCYKDGNGRNVHHSSSLSVPIAKEGQGGVARVRLERKDQLPLSPLKDEDEDINRLQYTSDSSIAIASSTPSPFVVTLEIAPKMLAKTTKMNNGDDDAEEEGGSGNGGSGNGTADSGGGSTNNVGIQSSQSEEEYKLSRIPSAKCEMYQNGKYAVKWRQVWAPQLITTVEMSSVEDKARLHTKLRPVSGLQVSSVMSSSMSAQTLQRAGVKVGCRLKGRESSGGSGRRVHMLEVESTMVVDRGLAYKVKYKTRGGRLINNAGVSVFGKRDEGREKGLKFELEAVW